MLRVCLAIILLTLAVALPASANTSYVLNGSFESTTNGNGQLGYNTNATNWTNQNNAGTWGYNFLFAPGTADTTGAVGSAGTVSLWGPGNGSNNGLTTSPNGGYFIAADPVYQTGTISQVINGLTVGQEYAVQFYWAGAQQYTFNGATTEGWQVTLGSSTQSTGTISNVSHGFTGWRLATMDFVATSTSETLSFLALGTPSGLPPFVLLDGVSMIAAPEPGTFVLIGLGLLAIPLGARRIRKRT